MPAKVFDLGETHPYLDAAVQVEGLAERRDAHVLEDLHHVVHLQIAELQGEVLARNLFYDAGVRQGILRSGAVRPDEPGNAQFHAAEVAHHNYEDVAQLLAQQLPVDGAAGRGGRLPVVAQPVWLAREPEAPGEAVVPRVELFLAQRCENLFCLIFRLDWVGEGQKLASQFLVEPFGGGCDRTVGVGK